LGGGMVLETSEETESAATIMPTGNKTTAERLSPMPGMPTDTDNRTLIRFGGC
jgi:hypothetical protein